MKIEIYSKGLFQVLKIEEELQIFADLSELKFLIEGYIKAKKHKIAISFSNISYIYSGAIAVIIECHKMLVDYKDGLLCILEPNKDIKAIFSQLNIDKILPVYDSEDDLEKYRE